MASVALTIALSVVTAVSGVHLWNTRAEYKAHGVSYHIVWAQRRFDRVLTAPLAHASLWHVGINLLLLWTGVASLEIVSPALLYGVQWYIGTRDVWYAHMLHRQVYAGLSGALIGVLTLAMLEGPVHDEAQAGAAGDFPPLSGNATATGQPPATPSAVFPIGLQPLLGVLALQLCVPAVSPLGHLGALMLGAGVALSAAVAPDAPVSLEYWAYSSTALAATLALPAAVAAGLLPSSPLCAAPARTWAAPDAAVIQRHLDTGAAREAARDPFGYTTPALPVSEGAGPPGRLPLRLVWRGHRVVVTGRAPARDSDEPMEEEEEEEGGGSEEEEVEGGAVAPRRAPRRRRAPAGSVTHGSVWHLPRPGGGSALLLHGGGPVLHRRFAPPPAPSRPPRALWALLPPTPRAGAGGTAPRRSTGGSGSVEEGAPLLAAEEAAGGASSAASGAGGVAGLGLEAGDVDLFAGEEEEGVAGAGGEAEEGAFLGSPAPTGAGEEQGRRGGTGTPAGRRGRK